MIRCTFLLLTLSLVLAPARGRAEDTYTIKVKQAAKGDKTRSDKQVTETKMLKVKDSQGNVLQEKNETVVEKSAYQDTVLEKPPEESRPTRLRRTYDLAEVTKGDDKQTLPYHGKTVLIEKKGERYQFQIEGGEELTGDAAQFLEKEFNRKQKEFDFEKLVIPKKPVRVQESWELDIDALCKELENTNGADVDRDKCKAIATLVKAYKQSGRQFGIINARLELPVKRFKSKTKTSYDQAATYGVEMTWDGCIDGSLNGGTLKFAIRLEGQGEVARGERKLKVTMKTDIHGQETQKELAQE